MSIPLKTLFAVVMLSSFYNVNFSGGFIRKFPETDQNNRLAEITIS